MLCRTRCILSAVTQNISKPVINYRCLRMQKIVQMAEGGKDNSPVESPGIGMKLTISGIKQKFSSVKNISTEALSSLMKTVPPATSVDETSVDETSVDATSVQSDTCRNDKLIILDSRPTEEYNVGHIPGARRVDYEAKPDHIVSDIPELQSPDGTITVVCYCSVGYRSSMVAQKISEHMKQSGKQLGKQSGSATKDAVKVYNLEGSIFKWANENRRMVDTKDRRTIYAHPYNAVFGKLLRKELRRTNVDASL